MQDVNATATGSRKLSLMELCDLPEPSVLGPQHRPIAHHKVIDAIERTASNNGFAVDFPRSTFAVNKSGSLMAGALVLSPGSTQANTGVDSMIGQARGSFALGILHDNVMRIALRIAAGFRIFVCENLTLSGESNVLHRKHTTGFDIEEAVDGMWCEVERSLNLLRETTERWNFDTITNDRAKAVSFDLVAGPSQLPARLLPAVASTYFAPDAELTEDVEPRNLWGLHNAFTRALRGTPQRALMSHTQALTRGIEAAYNSPQHLQ